MTGPQAQPDCAHCGLPVKGYGTFGDAKLCHPDIGLDCYHLVTLYRHQSPCEIPYCTASVQRRLRREANAEVAMNETEPAL